MNRAFPAALCALCLPAGGLYLYARPAYAASALDESTRPYVRRTGGGVFGRGSGRARNPGVRVFAVPGWDSAAQASLVRKCESLIPAYGVSHLTPAQEFAFALQMVQRGDAGDWAGEVNMTRLTGRSESAAQTVCPWRYAEDFCVEAVPPALRALAERLPHPLATLRDITINKRTDCYFRLDPHIDPAADGSVVVIVSANADAVLTLSPSRARAALRWASSILPGWTHTPWDLDVLLPAGHCLELTGPARHEWTHATRQGYGKRGSPLLFDTFGKQEVQRSRERLSIVFAFA